MEIIVGPNSTVNHFTPGNFAAYKVGATLDTSLWSHAGTYTGALLGEVISDVKRQAEVHAHLGHGNYDFAVLDTDTNYLVWATVELPSFVFAQTSKEAPERLLTAPDAGNTFRSLLTPQDEKFLRALKIDFEDAPVEKPASPVYHVRPTLSLAQLDELEDCRASLNTLSALVMYRDIAIYAPNHRPGQTTWSVRILDTPYSTEGLTLLSSVRLLIAVVEKLTAENKAYHFGAR